MNFGLIRIVRNNGNGILIYLDETTMNFINLLNENDLP